MDVVGHNDPRSKFIESSFLLASANRFREEVGNARVSQPSRARLGPIQFAIGRNEGFTLACPSSQQPPTTVDWQRAEQSPRQENRNPIRLDVWQSPSIFQHLTPENRAGGSACPTYTTEDLAGGRELVRKPGRILT
jgi:hypothetical protein